MVTPFLGALYALLTILFLTFLFLSSEKNGYTYARFFLFGFLYNCFTISLFYVFLPVPWVASIFLQYVGITLFILGGALVSGLSFLIVPFLLHFSKKKSFSFAFFPLIIFVSFIFQDLLRSFFVSLFLLGKESTLGLHFILGSLGEALAFTPLVILAYKGGIFLLTGILALLCFLFVQTLQKKIKPFHLILYLCALTLPFMFYELRELPRIHSLNIGILSTNWDNPQSGREFEDFKQRAENIQNLLASSSEPFDLLILPESTSYLDSVALIGEKPPALVKNYLDSAGMPKKEAFYTASLFYNGLSDITEERKKSLLMVFSEYDPYLMKLLEKLAFFSPQKRREELKGNDYHTFQIKNYHFAPLICSEGTSFMPLLSFEKEAPDFYTLQSNLVVMKERDLGFLHLYAYTRLIAATTGKSVFSANNAAPSYGFDGKGKLLYEIAPSLTIHSVTIP